MRLPSQRAPRLAGALAALGLGALLLPGIARAADAPLTVIISGNGTAFTADLVVSCEAPTAPSSGGVEIGAAATAERHSIAVPRQGGVQTQITGVTDGSICSMTGSGSGSARLTTVEGGTPVVGSDGRLRGVAVTVDRATPVIAHLIFSIPAARVATVPLNMAADATNTAGSGSAALAPPALARSDGAASAAAPFALAVARSTTTASSAALPDPSGTGTTLVLASVGLLICGAAAYGLVLTSRRHPRAQ